MTCHNLSKTMFIELEELAELVQKVNHILC